MKNILYISYFIFLCFVCFFSYLFIDSNLEFLSLFFSGFSSNNRFSTSVIYTGIIIIFFLFYLLFIRFFSKNKLNGKDIKKLIALTCIVLFFSYPAMLSYDIFNYIFTAKVAFFYHENPYIVMPNEFLNDPFLAFTRATNKIALYGPIWIILSGFPHFLGFGNFVLTLFGFKFVALAFYLLFLFILKKISVSDKAVLLFGLNPLVILEILVSAHNDIVMIFLVLFAMYIAKTKKMFYMIIFFALSLLIKYSTIALLPIFIYLFIKIVRNEQLNWSKIYLVSAALMFLVFLLSPIREEMYPWYTIWFLPFVALHYKNKIFNYLSISLCFGLLLGYIPFIYLGTYLEPTPTIKQIVTFVPSALFALFYVIKKKI